MPLSAIYLGMPKDYESMLHAQTPCSLSKLHWAAKRTCQLLSQGNAGEGALEALLPST
jgi:hypothetical protein